MSLVFFLEDVFLVGFDKKVGRKKKMEEGRWSVFCFCVDLDDLENETKGKEMGKWWKLDENKGKISIS
jgi:hypothetical protein